MFGYMGGGDDDDMHDYHQLQNLRKENTQVRATIQTWLDKQGHDRCWFYPELFRQLAQILDLKPTVEPKLPPRADFRACCQQYEAEEYANVPKCKYCDNQPTKTLVWLKDKRGQPARIAVPWCGCNLQEALKRFWQNPYPVKLGIDYEVQELHS